MSLISDLQYTNSGDSASFNTGTIFDLATGRYVPGYDGNWYINGGLSEHINAIVGPNGGFKSTTACSLIMRSMGIYKDAELIIEDTENSLDKDKSRAYHMSEDLYSDDIMNRTIWLKGIDYNIDEITELIKTICKKKMDNKKEYRVLTPFIDVTTGERLEMWKPTYVFIDSETELISASEEELLDSKTISDANTLNILDGNKKTTFNHVMRSICQKYGIILIVTGHFDKIVQMDMYNPLPKDTTFSVKDWKTKKCGSNLKFLASNYARTKANLLLDQSKLPIYGGVGGPAKDCLEIELTIERCKTSNAGEAIPFVETQSTGVLNAITNYHYLRLHDYFGLTGSKQKQQTAMLPEITISRNTVRELTESNYQLRRALELTAQYCFIKNNWVTSGLAFDFSKDPKEIFDKLNSDKNKNVVNDILNSRGYWTYSENEHPYMDIFKVLELCGVMK